MTTIRTITCDRNIPFVNAQNCESVGLAILIDNKFQNPERSLHHAMCCSDLFWFDMIGDDYDIPFDIFEEQLLETCRRFC